MSETTHRAARLALASLLLVALVAQLAIGLSSSILTVVNFFSYFTVLSNAAGVVLLVLLAARPRRDSQPAFAMFRGAVTVYMSVTGLVYALFLFPVAAELGTAEPWIDWSIHVLGPVALALDWILSPPPTRLAGRSTAIWLIFPAAYLTYSLLRGLIVDWYPYPFLDPRQGGYVEVTMWSAGVLAMTVVFSLAYHRWSNGRVGVSVPA